MQSLTWTIGFQELKKFYNQVYEISRKFTGSSISPFSKKLWWKIFDWLQNQWIGKKLHI